MNPAAQEKKKKKRGLLLFMYQAQKSGDQKQVLLKLRTKMNYLY
jgi:hypothetical protein